MRIPLLYRGEYSQWCERFMNYLEEKTDGEAMINSIQNGDQQLPIIAQVSLAGNAQNVPPIPKDPKFWTAEEKKTRKIDRLARSLLIQGLPNDIYSLNDSEQDRKAAILYEYETFKAIEGEQLLDTYLRYLQVINDLKKCGYKKDNCDVNDALGYKKKAVVVTSDPLTLVAEKTKMSKRKEKVVVSSDSEGSGVDEFSELKKITTLLAKAFNRRKFYSKPTNNSLRTSSTSQSTNKKQDFVKSDDKKVENKDDEKKRDMSKVKFYNCKKEGHFAKDCKKAKVLSESDESSSSAEETSAESEVNHNDSEEKEHLVDKLIRKFNHKIAKCQKRIETVNQQSKDLKNQNKDLQDKYDVLINQVNTFEKQNNEFNEQIKVLNEKNADLLAQTEVLQDQLKVKHVVIDTHTECQAQYAKLEEERYEYTIRYSALCDNDKQHRKKIDEQEILFDKMRHQLVEMNNNVLRLQEKILEKETKISELEECVSNKDIKIEKFLERLNECENKLHKIVQTNQIIHMIMPSKDTLYNGRKGIDFENPSYFEKAKDLRPSLYDEKQTSSLKPYVPNVILEKIIIDLEDEVVSLLEKEKANLKTIESLKSIGFESSENEISESENQSENDCHVVKKECDNMENSKVIAPGIFKLNLDTFSSVRRHKHSGVIWKKKRSSNTSNVDLSSVSHLKLNKNVKRYSHKDLLSCNNSHLGETSSAYVCNDAMNVSCNSRMCDLFDENNLFIFDDESVRISPVIKMPLRKKPRDSMNIIHICLWIIDSGCSKHMTGNRAILTNFVEKFLGTVRFGNNDFAVIAGYGDVVIRSMKTKKVYYVEGLGHNLFSVGQFCGKGLEVAFRKSTCFVRNEDGVDLLTGDRSLNLYTIALNEVAVNSSTCLLAKASSSQSWLWHQRLSHLNFATINNLVKNNLVQGLPKMKFEKVHLCFACEQGKIHRKHHKSKTAFTSNKPLYLLHMDLCGP
nr:ribonuclease H-like domain-containing protein [Tanacetum cinerariifolium]